MGYTRDEGQEAPRAGAGHDSAFGRASLVGGVTLLRAPAFPVEFLGILAHWSGSCPRDFACSEHPAHFRVPPRHGWGRLAHGPAVWRVDAPDLGWEVAPKAVVQDTEKVTRRGGRARLKASDSKSDRGVSPSGVQILSPPPN